MNLRTVILQSPMILPLSTPPRVFPAVGKYRQQCCGVSRETCSPRPLASPLFDKFKLNLFNLLIAMA